MSQRLAQGQPGKTAKIDVAIDVAIDYEKRLVAEQGQGVGDAAGGFQRARRFRRIADSQTPLRAVAERCLDLLAEVGVVDDDLGEPGCRQSFQMPGDERLAAHRQQRLGRVVGQRAHPFAASCGKNEGFHQKV